MRTPMRVKTGHHNIVLLDRREFTEFIKDVHDTMVEMLPGVKHIALQNYERLNEVMIELGRLVRTMEGP